MTSREIAYQAGVLKNWDDFRVVYDDLSIDDLIEINTSWNDILPCQSYCRPDLFTEMFKLIDEINLRVVELGCYLGNLATTVIEATPSYKISKWVGYDINHKAIDTAVVGAGLVFRPMKQEYWFWHTPFISSYDVFASAHTLEHHNWEQVKQILAHVSQCKYVFLEVPFGDWNGTSTSHVLKARHGDFDRRLGVTHTKIYEKEVSPTWITGWRKK